LLASAVDAAREAVLAGPGIAHSPFAVGECRVNVETGVRVTQPLRELTDDLLAILDAARELTPA